MLVTHVKMGYFLVKWDFFILPLRRNQKKHKVMRKLLLLKHSGGRTAIVLYFKNENQVRDWWTNLPCPEEFILVCEMEREKSGHRFDLTYSKLDEAGKLYTKHVICFSKRESIILEEKIKEINPNYKTNIKKIY